jgi:hypothetical protein
MDPLTRNSYSYVNGDPVNLVDSSGHRPACPEDGGTSWHCDRNRTTREQLVEDYVIYNVIPQATQDAIRCAHEGRMWTCANRPGGRLMGAIWDSLSRTNDCSNIGNLLVRGLCDGAVGIANSVISAASLLGSELKAVKLAVTGHGREAVAQGKDVARKQVALGKGMVTGTLHTLQLVNDLTPQGFTANAMHGGLGSAFGKAEYAAGALTPAATVILLTAALSIPVPAELEALDATAPGAFAGSAAVAEDSSGFVNLASEARTAHILDGEVRANGTYGGGHRAGSGFPGKSEFPASWSDDQIMHNISDVATDPSITWRAGVKPGDFWANGTRGGIDIEVLLRNDEIWTGYPTNVPRNP